MNNYELLVEGHFHGQIEIIKINGTFALPLLKIYKLINAEIQYEDHIIYVQYKGIKMTIVKQSDSPVLDETGNQMLWQPPGSTCEIIRLWYNNDLFVDEDSLFALLFDTTEWYFHINTEDQQLQMDRR